LKVLGKETTEEIAIPFFDKGPNRIGFWFQSIQQPFQMLFQRLAGVQW